MELPFARNYAAGLFRSGREEPKRKCEIGDMFEMDDIHFQIPVPPIHSPPVGSPLHLYTFYIQCSPLSGYPLVRHTFASALQATLNHLRCEFSGQGDRASGFRPKGNWFEPHREHALLHL
jgi:hypothetical protein